MELAHKRQRDELSEDSDIIDEINENEFLQGMGPQPTKCNRDEPYPAIDLLRYVTILWGQQNSELSSSAIHNQSQSPFFSLPGEVRNRIYKYLTPNVHVHAAPSTQRLHVTFCAQTTEPGEYGKQAQERLAAARNRTQSNSGYIPSDSVLAAEIYKEGLCCVPDERVPVKCRFTVCEVWCIEFKNRFWDSTIWTMTLPTLNACSEKAPSLLSRMRQVELYAIPQHMTPAPYCVDGIKRLLDIEALSLAVCLRPRQFSPDKTVIRTQLRMILRIL